MNNKKPTALFFILLVPVFFCIAFYYYIVKIPLSHKEGSVFITLPYYGPKELVPNGKDTIYHTIPDFSFTNQDGVIKTQNDYKGSIYVANYFFTTCKTICPKMAVLLQKLQNKIRYSKSVFILSHTVDPETDNVLALKEYARMVHANTDQWNFVTGDKKQLYDLARNGYLINALEGDGGPDDFIHSEQLVLIDKEGHIRGYYDGTLVKEIDRLVSEIKVLQSQYAPNNIKK